MFYFSGSEDLVATLVETNGEWQRETLRPASSTVETTVCSSVGLFARVERWTDLQTG